MAGFFDKLANELTRRDDAKGLRTSQLRAVAVVVVMVVASGCYVVAGGWWVVVRDVDA